VGNAVLNLNYELYRLTEIPLIPALLQLIN